MNAKRFEILALGFALALIIAGCGQVTWPTIGPVCGNAFCELGEDISSCPDDCIEGGQACGNQVCESPEDVGNCSPDCAGTCGDGICNDFYEDLNSCAADCTLVCGNGVCEEGEDAENCAADCAL